MKCQNIRQAMKFKRTEADFLQIDRPMLPACHYRQVLSHIQNQTVSTAAHYCHSSAACCVQHPTSIERPHGTQPDSCCSRHRCRAGQPSPTCVLWLGVRLGDSKALDLMLTWFHCGIRLKESLCMQKKYVTFKQWSLRSRSIHGSFFFVYYGSLIHINWSNILSFLCPLCFYFETFKHQMS